VVGDLKEFAANELTRLVVVGDEQEIQRLETELKSEFNSRLYVTRSLPHFCEILHPQAGKDRALAWISEYLGVRQDETVAFGNGYNDVQMLEWAGLGVAVGGAVSEVLQVADRIAPPIEEDGAAQVLEELLDQGLIG
jgi:HAD superfamily hydrolase (TIGR01484 family)